MIKTIIAIILVCLISCTSMYMLKNSYVYIKMHDGKEYIYTNALLTVSPAEPNSIDRRDLLIIKQKNKKIKYFDIIEIQELKISNR